MIVRLPWPNKGLLPNARIHWAPLAKLKAAAREEAAWETKASVPLAERRAIAQSEGRIPLTVTFYPPDRRKRDDDGMVSSFKSYRDGIADALGVDDNRFQPTYVFGDAAKPGWIEVAF